MRAAKAGVPGWWRGPLPVVRLALWFGLVGGLVELLLLAIRVKSVEKGPFLRSPHFVWMVPVSNLALFGVAALLVGLAARAWPRRGQPLVAGAFVGLACLGWLLLMRGFSSLACLLIACGIARQCTPLLAAVWTPFLALVRRSLPVLLGVLVVLVGVGVARDGAVRPWAASRRPATPANAPNVLLIVLDTVRADRLSLYGYPRETTPQLARFAQRGVRFDQARSAAPWTLPSHANMFTARWPHELDVERHGRLVEGFPTLAERLRGRGYATVGVVGNQFFCHRESGLARGFDEYYDFPLTVGEVVRSSSVGWLLARAADRARAELAARLSTDTVSAVSLDFRRKEAAEVNREFLDWLARRGDRPFFAFLNYFDAHDPYLVPQGARTHFGRVPRSRAEALLLRDWQKVDSKIVSAEAVGLASDAYDDCIAALDSELGRLFDALDRRGVLDHTIVIITADHGEQFGEHGGFRHGVSLYDSEVRVPLVMVAPSHLPAGRVVHAPVSLRDLPATVVDLLGWRQAALFPGTSLVGAVDGKAGPDPSAGTAVEPPLAELRTLIEPTGEKARLATAPESLEAVVSEGRVYIRHARGKEELYDFAADPAESHDLSTSEGAAPILSRLRGALARVLRSPGSLKKAGVPRFPRRLAGSS